MAAFNRILTSWFPPKQRAEREKRMERKSPPAGLMPTVDLRTAEAAEMLRDNPAFTKIMDRMRAARVDEFVSSKTEDTEIRDKAHMGLAVLDQIETDIQVMADEMKLHRRIKDGEAEPERPVGEWT